MRYWHEASGDSYVVDVRDVMGAYGAAAYLGKYLTKAALSYSMLQQLGFTRRWSRSNNWPVGDRLQLLATKEGRWSKVTFGISGRDLAERDRERGNPLLERVGDDLSVTMGRRVEKKRLLSLIGKVQKCGL